MLPGVMSTAESRTLSPAPRRARRSKKDFVRLREIAKFIDAFNHRNELFLGQTQSRRRG